MQTNHKLNDNHITMMDVLATMFKCLLVKGSIQMVDMYYRLVKAGLRTIQKVPDQFRDAVMANLTTLPLQVNDNSISTPTSSNVTVSDVNNADTQLNFSGDHAVNVMESAVLGVSTTSPNKTLNFITN